MRPLWLALAVLMLLGASAKPTNTRARGSSGTGVAAAGSLNLGILPASPDTNVLLARLGTTVTKARTDGAKYLYFYRDPNDLGSTGTADLMGYLGHPVAITLTVWEGATVNTNGLPTECGGTWSTDGCIATIAQKACEFAGRYLRRGDYLLVGNESNGYFNTHASEIPTFKVLVKRVQSCMPSGIAVGPVFAYAAGADALITQLWDPSYGFLCLNAYGFTGVFDFSAGPAAGITILDTAQTFARTLTRSWGICETGWSSSATVGSSEANQQTWAGLLRAWAATSSAQMINVFIALDGVITGCTDQSVPGDVCYPCYARATVLGFSPGTDDSEVGLCRLGLLETDGTERDGWDTLWGL